MMKLALVVMMAVAGRSLAGLSIADLGQLCEEIHEDRPTADSSCRGTEDIICCDIMRFWTDARIRRLLIQSGMSPPFSAHPNPQDGQSHRTLGAQGKCMRYFRGNRCRLRPTPGPSPGKGKSEGKGKLTAPIDRAAVQVSLGPGHTGPVCSIGRCVKELCRDKRGGCKRQRREARVQKRAVATRLAALLLETGPLADSAWGTRMRAWLPHVASLRLPSSRIVSYCHLSARYVAVAIVSRGRG